MVQLSEGITDFLVLIRERNLYRLLGTSSLLPVCTPNRKYYRSRGSDVDCTHQPLNATALAVNSIQSWAILIAFLILILPSYNT